MASSARTLPRNSRLPAPINRVSGPQWLILLVVLVGMALVGNELVRRTITNDDTTATTLSTGTVGQRTIDSTVSATGTVSPIRQVKVTFGSAGQVQEVLVKQGDRVVEGQPLASLNGFNLEIKRDQARANLGSAQYRLEALLQGPTTADVAAAQQSVALAQSTVTRAQNDLYNLLAGPSADDVAAARAALDKAQVSLTVAQTNWDKLTNRTDLALRPEYATLQAARSSHQQALTNYQNRTAPPNPLDVSNAQASLASAQASLDSSRARLAQTLAGSDPLDIANARNLVTSAQAALDAAQAKLRDLQNPTGATAIELAALEAQVTAARANLAAAQASQTESLLGGAGSDVRARSEASVVAAQAALLTAQNNQNKAVEKSQPNSADVLAAQQTVASAQTSLLNAQNNLAKLQQGPNASDVAAGQQAVTAAENLVQTARNNLDKLLQGSTAEDIAAARTALDNATAALETAQTNWDRLDRGVDLETRPEYTALIAARTEYQTALSSLNTRTQGAKAGDVAATEATVDSANATLTSAFARLAQVQGGSLATDIGVARESVTNAELALRQAQKDLDNATIASPFKGTVVSVGVNPGDQVTGSTAAFSILDPDLIRVDATVDESNVVKLRPGMPVAVTFDALQGRSFQGTVATVTPAGVTQQGVVTFPVQVVFNGQGNTIPPGTTANLRIVTESKSNVVAVPSRAIQRQGRETFVQVMVNGKPEQRAVRTGVTGDNFTEILEGLEPGETIVTSAQQQNAAVQGGAFGTSGLPGLGTGAPAQPVRR